MKSIIKTLSGAACAMAVFVMVSLTTGVPAAAESKAPSSDPTEQYSQQTRWQMVWVKDLPSDDFEHPDLAVLWDGFMKQVNIHTAVIDGEITLTSASAKCNFMGRSLRRRVVKPALTTETLRDGKLHYETVPAVYEPYWEFSTTQKACSFRHEIEGEIYDVDWPMQMERFLSGNNDTPINIRAGNILEWEDESGEIIARFEKLPGISIHKNYWRLDPDIHSDDRVLEQYFGPATVVINFPKISSYRGCSRIYAQTALNQNKFSIIGEVKAYPCKDLSALVGGERMPYTPGANSAENILETHLPNVSQYVVTEEGDTRRLVLSDDNGNALINLISTSERPARKQDISARIYDLLDEHEWVIEPGKGDAVSPKASPIRILGHLAYRHDLAKSQASLISAQGCALRGLNIDGKMYEKRELNITEFRALKNGELSVDSILRF